MRRLQALASRIIGYSPLSLAFLRRAASSSADFAVGLRGEPLCWRRTGRSTGHPRLGDDGA